MRGIELLYLLEDILNMGMPESGDKLEDFELSFVPQELATILMSEDTIFPFLKYCLFYPVSAIPASLIDIVLAFEKQK